MSSSKICALAAVLASQAAGTSVESELASAPVTKVVTLLKDMLKQMEKEADEDQEIFDKMGCWCETNDKEKTQAILDAEEKIKLLTTNIEEFTAKSARYSTEIKNAQREVAKNQNALDTATANRRKQLADFNAEEKDALESIQALKGALVVLSKQNSFLQVPRHQMLGVAGTLQREMQKHAPMLEHVFTPSNKKVAVSFIQSPEDYFDAEPTFKQSYAPQSGQIHGILSQMKETFEANLAQAQKDDHTAQTAFLELKAAKEDEIAAGQAQVDDKTQELASTNEKNENAKADLVDTKASLGADNEFLMMLKEKCQMTKKEFEDRTKTRGLEMEAVAKAMEILDGDAAHDVFSRTLAPALLQSEATTTSQRRKEASNLLFALGGKERNPRFAALALKVRLDAFTEVKKAIDDLIGALTKEKEEEIMHRDFCINEFNSNQKQTSQKDREKQDNTALMEDLTMHMEQLTADIEKLNAEIDEMNTQLKRAGDDRDTQNQDFQMTVADQRETQKLLQAALRVLEGFYGKKALAAAFAQRAGPPPPPGFEGYKKSGASGDVMELIQQIIDDAKALESEAIRADQEAQAAYENFVKETTASVATKNKEIRSKNEEKAKTEQDLGEAKGTQESLLLELEQLSNTKTQLHVDCDFTIKNFEIRQSQRDEEVEGLRQAKAILSGSSAGR